MKSIGILCLAWLAAAGVACGQAEGADATCAEGAAGVRQMLEHLNGQRKQYEKHAPYDGYPWRGNYVKEMTWPLELQWDESLSAKAQKEAERLAGGGRPEGREYKHQRFGLFGERTESVWLRGLETAEYEIDALSKVGTKEEERWQAPGNGTMRLAAFYQTGTGERGVKRRVGIGKSCKATGEAWWVMVFGE